VSGSLPPNATQLEASLADVVVGRIEAVPVEAPIRSLWNPATISAELLPWLAWALSVDVWDDAWPEEKKRHVVATALLRHRKKGTLAGLREYVGLAGGRVVRAVTPPAKTFLEPALTNEEREAFLRRFPQLRIYPYRSRGAATRGAFVGREFLGAAAFPYTTDARARIGRRAFYWDRGVEIPALRLEREIVVEGRTAYDFETILVPGSAPGVPFLGQPPPSRLFLTPGGAPGRVVSVRVDRAYNEQSEALRLSAIAPGLSPVDVRPRRAYEPGAGRGVFAGRGAGRFGLVAGFLAPSTAGERVFDRIYLHDPKRLPDVRRRGVHVGATRLGIPPYHAEISVEIPGRHHARHVGQFVWGHLRPADPAALERTLAAVRSSKAARDRILLNTKTRRRPRAGDRLKVGAAAIGDFVRA
jgi:phage tail P2-like protein